MTVALTVQQILFMHARPIATTGGEHGVLELELLQAAVALPQGTCDGIGLVAGLLQKAVVPM